MIPPNGAGLRRMNAQLQADRAQTRHDLAAAAAPAGQSGAPDAKRPRTRAAHAALAALQATHDARERSLPGLVKLQPGEQRHLARFFAPGSRDASNLSMSSRALHHAWQDQALADQLIAELKRPWKGGERFPIDFRRIISRSSHLPPVLQFNVLEAIPAKVCKWLGPGGGHMETVLHDLSKASRRLAVNHRFVIMERISAAIGKPIFRSTCLDPHAGAIDQSAMEQVFRRFCADLHALHKNHGEEYARFLEQWFQPHIPVCKVSNGETDADDSADAAEAPERADLDAMRMSIASFCTRIEMRGLYLIPNADDRAFRWHALLDRTASFDPYDQLDVLPELIARIRELRTDVQRLVALECAVSLVTALPPQMQYDGLLAVTEHLPCVRANDANRDIFAQVQQLAIMAPPGRRSISLHLIAKQIRERPHDERAAIFNHTLRQVGDLPQDERSLPLQALAAQMSYLPEAHGCTAYDAIKTAIEAIPAALQPAAAAVLFKHGSAVADGIARHTRFFEAIDFIGAHPEGERASMVAALAHSLWRQSDDAVRLQCLDAQLALARSLPPAARQINLHALYQVDLGEADASFQCCVSRRLLDEIGMLPDAARTQQMAVAIRHSLLFHDEGIAPAIRLIVQRVQAMPALLQNAAREAITADFDVIVDGHSGARTTPLAIYSTFDALLGASEHFPDSLRMHLLEKIRLMLDRADLPALERETLSRQLAGKVNALPIPLLARMTGSRMG